MSTETLVALLSGEVVGTLMREVGRGRARLTFTYDERWRAAEESFPLSLSMPLASATHGHDAIEPYLLGLLPDDADTLGRWARRFGVSPTNAFGVIANVGEDCAGAVQFVPPERVAAIRHGGPPSVEWLDERGVATRLRALRQDPSAWRKASDTGQFSLAGAQPKTALVSFDGRWGVPSGRTPTTHILKPPVETFDGRAENEYFCLELARAIGLRAAESHVMRFEEERAIVVRRYDRAFVERPPTLGSLVRVHQEDVCQALGVRPTAKYEADGGPGAASVVELLRRYSANVDRDVASFIHALAFNWVIAGTDGHAKNYSILHGAGRRVRLAPLYDLASALPYPDMPEQKLALAMRIGGENRIRSILRRKWERLAEESALPADEVVRRAHALAENVAVAAPVLARRLADEGLTHPIIPRLGKLLSDRAARCARNLEGRSGAKAFVPALPLNETGRGDRDTAHQVSTHRGPDCSSARRPLPTGTSTRVCE